MKHTKLLPLVLLFSLSSMAFAETVYVCPLKNGKNEYTSTYRPGCVDAKLKKMDGYQPVTSDGSSTYTAPAETRTDAAPQPSQATNNAESELAAAERALAEGKAVRYGNERNYAKYQERIQKLEEDVERARANLQTAPNNNNAR